MSRNRPIPGGKTDVMTAAQRSRCMSHIRGRNTGPEMMLRRALWNRGMRYRVKNSLTGRPDIVFPRTKTVVFVDGCFWHGCPLHSTQPKSNRRFWEKKLRGNIERDRRVTAQLENEGWTVLRFWEHEIKSGLKEVAEKIVKKVRMQT